MRESRKWEHSAGVFNRLYISALSWCGSNLWSESGRRAAARAGEKRAISLLQSNTNLFNDMARCSPPKSAFVHISDITWICDGIMAMCTRVLTNLQFERL